MRQIVRFGIFGLLPLLLLTTGCASKKKQANQLNSLQAQVAVLTDEVERLDQSLQELRGTQPGTQVSGGGAAEGGSAGGPIYRTPSGFELPAMSIQQALKNAGYYNGAVDGKIGAKSEEAIKAFQRDQGLEADGVVGRNTWTKLKANLRKGAVK